MAIEITELQKQFDALKSENEALKASIKENDNKAIQAKADSLAAEVAGLSAEKVALATELASTKSANEVLTKNVEELNKNLAESADELKKIYANQTAQERLAKLVAAMKVDLNDAEAVKAAEELNESLTALTKEKFESFLASQAKFSSAPLPPKSTPAPTAPLVTGKPAPMAGKAAETDGGEANANTESLDTAVAATQPSLVTIPASDAVSVLGKSVAKFFGHDDETK